jgi:hypothetical protein
MCPQLKDTICGMADIGPEHLDCVQEEHCLGDGWPGCSVYISQFFFDRNDNYIE